MSTATSAANTQTTNPPETAAPEAPKGKKVAVVKEDAVLKPLSEARLKLTVASAADVGNQFAATTPIRTPFENVLEPEFWSQVAYKLRPGDEITIHTDDMTYTGRLYVRDVSKPSMSSLPNRAVVAKLAFLQLGPLEKDLRTKTHEAKFMGPHLKWCVIALDDQAVLKDGFSTAEDAQGWMRSRAA